MKLAIIGDFDINFRPHEATNEAISHSLRHCNLKVQSEWISTDSIEANFKEIVSTFNGFWIAPGSPYKSMSGVLEIIKYARLNNIPTLGTCGGFQHMVIEFARNVLGMNDAEHAEYDPYASKLVVNPLSCSLAGQTLEIEIISNDSKISNIYNSDHIKEKYYCNFGLNPEYQDLIDKNNFKIVGTDKNKEARILELSNHVFFIATLFVPQDNSHWDRPNKLITEFLKKIEKKEHRTIMDVAQ